MLDITLHLSGSDRLLDKQLTMLDGTFLQIRFLGPCCCRLGHRAWSTAGRTKERAGCNTPFKLFEFLSLRGFWCKIGAWFATLVKAHLVLEQIGDIHLAPLNEDW